MAHGSLQLEKQDWRCQGLFIMENHPATALKIFTAEQWTQFEADGIFHGAPIDIADGYIHMSAAPELQGTLDKYFAGQAGLVIVEVDLAVLGDLVRWEESRGGALFPHIYGPLPIAAVTAYRLHPPG